MRIAKHVWTRLLVTLTLVVFTPVLMALDQERLEFWETVACPNEDVDLVGSVRFQAQAVEGADHTTWIFQAFWRGTGTGLDSGADYLLVGKWMEVIEEDPPFLFIWNDHFQLIGKGTTPDYRFSNKVKVVVDANGNIIIDEDSFEWPCDTVDGGVG